MLDFLLLDLHFCEAGFAERQRYPTKEISPDSETNKPAVFYIGPSSAFNRSQLLFRTTYLRQTLLASIST